LDNNFKYKTDELGRVEKITIDNLNLNSNKERDAYQQGLAKTWWCSKFGDKHFERN
jgi:hypothetical protein